MASLKIVTGANVGQVIEWSGREMVVGREPTCEIVIPLRTVSRRHARIMKESDGFYVEDLRSINGTGINGHRISRRTKITNGDRIHVFDTVFLFSDGSRSGVRTSATPAETDVDLMSETEPGSGSSHAIVTELDVDHESDELSTDRSAEKLRAVLRISQSLGTTLDIESMLPNILEALFQIFPQSQRGYILQPTSGNDELAPTAIKHSGEVSDTISPIGGKVAQRVMHDGTAFISGDVDADELRDAEESIFDEPVRSIMCAPLMGPSRTVVGVIHIETGDAKKPFSQNDLEVLATVALLAGQAVEFARMHESLMELDWRRREVALAKDVQLQFLPSKPPSVSNYAFFHHYLAADHVAGDYFDYVSLPDGRMAVVQGDVAGKGMSAAMLMARLCSDVRFCLAGSESAAAAVSGMNYEICEAMDNDLFVTLALFVIDPKSHEVTWVSAGHPPAILRHRPTRTSEFLPIENANLPLGLDKATKYTEQSFTMEPGHMLVCYTDGINEAMNPDGKHFGTQAVRDAVHDAGPEPKHVGRALVSEVRRFVQGAPQSDDMCIVCFSREQ